MEDTENLAEEITALNMELALTHRKQVDENVSYVVNVANDDDAHMGTENGFTKEHSSEEADLEAALMVNKEYQEILNAQLRNIEAAMNRNKDLQKKFRAKVEKAKNPQQKRAAPQSTLGKRIPGVPYFTDQDGSRPPENEDTTKLRPEFERSALAFKFKKWNKTELAKLSEAIRSQNKQLKFDALMKEIEDYNMDWPEFGRLSQDLENIPQSDYEKNVDGIKWDDVAAQIGTHRTAMDCKICWLNTESPTISKLPWTKEEDTKLVRLAKKYKGFNWTTVAIELGTNRAPVQCMRRYQRNLNTNIVKTSWSSEEDAMLTEAVKKYGEKNWQQVAHALVGRTGQQCLHRWDKTLKPTIRKGRWSEEEDKKLIAAVELVGAKSWVKVAQHVQGRTDMQCRERWVNVLNPQLSKLTWSTDEDERLAQAIAMYLFPIFMKWSQVASVVVTRTDNQCWRRWKSLNPAGVVDDYRVMSGGTAKKPKKSSSAQQEKDNEEQELKLVNKRRKIDIRNARKIGKALDEGVQSAVEPEEPIHIETVPPPIGQIAAAPATIVGEQLRKSTAPTPKRGRGRPPKVAPPTTPPPPRPIPAQPGGLSTAAPVTPNAASPAPTPRLTPSQIRQESISAQEMQQVLIQQQRQLQQLQAAKQSSFPPTPSSSTSTTTTTTTTATTSTLPSPRTPSASAPTTPSTPKSRSSSATSTPKSTPKPTHVPLSARRRAKVKYFEPESTDEDEEDDSADEDFKINKRAESEDEEEEEEGEDEVDEDEEEDLDNENDEDAEMDDDSEDSSRPKIHTLAFVYPSAPILVGLYRMFLCLDKFKVNLPPANTSGEETHSMVEPYVTLPEFKVLATWFNSLFYYSMKLFPHNLDEVVNPNTTNNNENNSNNNNNNN